MANFDIPNEQELKPGTIYNYDLVPTQYPIEDNNTVSTYNQFIQLRDTLVFTGKKYPGKATRKLCIGGKLDGSDTGTVEIWEPETFIQRFQSTRRTDENTPGILGKYITSPDGSVPQEILQQIGPLCCQIQRDGHYRIVHKEEVLLTATTEKVYCYVDIYRKNSSDVWGIAYKGGVAVFDWQGAGTLTGTTSGTDPNGSCSVPFKLGQLIQKMTAFGYMERDLLKGDVLVLRMKDADVDPSTGEPTGNDLTIQNDSNYWSIEYLDLPYNI